MSVLLLGVDFSLLGIQGGVEVHPEFLHAVDHLIQFLMLPRYPLELFFDLLLIILQPLLPLNQTLLLQFQIIPFGLLLVQFLIPHMKFNPPIRQITIKMGDLIG